MNSQERRPIMPRLSSFAYVVALLGLVIPGTALRAEMTHWSFETGSNPNPVPPSNPLPDAISGNVGIVFDGVTVSDVAGSQTVRMFNLFTAGGGLNPLIFTSQSFKPSITITDTASHTQGTLFFSGLFNGTAHPNTQVSSVAATFLSPTAQSIVLGTNKYVVTIGPYHPLTWKSFGPNVGQGEFDGSIDNQVNVSAAGSPAATPEPSCLVLAGMGMVTVAGAAWRRRRCKPGSNSKGKVEPTCLT
jgi:hypothetical protein